MHSLQVQGKSANYQSQIYVNSLQDNRKKGKCVLMTFFLFEEKNSWTSGEKFCSTSTTEPPVPLDKGMFWSSRVIVKQGMSVKAKGLKA